MKQGDLLRVELCGPESNPKESGIYPVQWIDGIFGNVEYYKERNQWDTPYLPDFWYSEVTERLYTADEIHEVIRNGFYSDSFQEFISQLNKDKDK